jgi:hypothetical protein
MLFVNHATSTKKAKDYFTEYLSRSDYYMRDAQEVAGQWHGRGAEMLGLSGQVYKDSYFRLCENINPLTGEQLTPRTVSAGIKRPQFRRFCCQTKPAIGEDAVQDSIPASKSPA